MLCVFHYRDPVGPELGTDADTEIYREKSAEELKGVPK